MKIEKNKVVTFHYTLSEPGKGELENSKDQDPVSYLHGHNGMLQGVEDALEGKAVDEKVNITLEPEQAYGPVRENAVQRVPLKHIAKSSKRAKLKPGMVVQVNTANGLQEVVVVKAGLKNVDVDTNHPFAGKTLTFDIEISEVRDATEEELSHGHSHGVGGHQH